MKKYILTKIDLLDAFIFADIFDEEKYQIITENENIDELIPIAINEFKKANSQFNSWKEWVTDAEDGGYEIEIMRDRLVIFKGSILLLDPIIEKSIFLSLKWHRGSKRKTGDDTDMVHLLQAANILRLQNRSEPDKDLIASALCHDLLEDTKCTENEILEASGKEVLRIVKACSNDSGSADNIDWEKKKIKYVNSVKNGGEKAMLISLADKIANARSLIELHKNIGDKIWNDFNRGKDKKLWFEKMVYKMFDENLKSRGLLTEYESLIQKMQKL